MQGQTQSSESIWTAFNNVTTAAVRQLRWQLKISWKRAVGSGGFATVGSSLVNSTDIVQGLEGIVSETDRFLYFDETEHLIRFEYDRMIQEPLGGIATAIGNLVLENIDGRFTPNQNATIGTAILPNRPLQMFFGFIVGTIEKVLPIFKGITRMVRESKPDSTVSIECFDYISHLNEFQLDAATYVSQTSDQIIEDILNSVGFGVNQYVLEEGLNTIGFAFFQTGQTAGERIRQLAEAEEGSFFQDEAGLLRFYNRRHSRTAPFNAEVWDIETDDIVVWEDDENTELINSVVVRSQSREVQALGVVWTDVVEEELSSTETRIIWASLDDPISSLTVPVANTDYTAFTGTAGSGSDVTASLSVIATTFVNTVKITLVNNSGNTMYVNLLQLRGTAAIVVNNIEESYEDTTSISKFNEQQLIVENDFIDEASFAGYLARVLVSKYKDPKRRAIVTVQGIPQLQLWDWVRLREPTTNVYIDCRVMRIQGQLSDGLFSQTLTLREITDAETDAWAIVGITQVGSTTEFVGI